MRNNLFISIYRSVSKMAAVPGPASSRAAGALNIRGVVVTPLTTDSSYSQRPVTTAPVSLFVSNIQGEY